jgi:hypothetical protein
MLSVLAFALFGAAFVAHGASFLLVLGDVYGNLGLLVMIASLILFPVAWAIGPWVLGFVDGEWTAALLWLAGLPLYAVGGVLRGYGAAAHD